MGRIEIGELGERGSGGPWVPWGVIKGAEEEERVGMWRLDLSVKTLTSLGLISSSIGRKAGRANPYAHSEN